MAAYCLLTCALFITWSVMVTVVPVEGATCSQSAIDRCEAGFEEYVQDDGIYRGYTREEMTSLCRTYDEFDVCIKPFEKQCDDEVKYQLEGLDLAYGYMCGEGFEIRVKNYECYANQAVDDQAERCAESYESSADRIIRELSRADTQSQVDRLVDEFCSVVETLLQCIYNTFKRNCNSEVADMQTRVERLLIKPIMDALGCGKDTTPSARIEYTTKRNEPSTMRPGTGRATCSQRAIETCEAGFEEYVQDDGIYRGYTKNELTSLCRTYNEFDVCIKPFEKQCDAETKYLLEGLDLAYGYMCGEGFEIRVRNYECYANQAVDDQAERCAGSYKSSEARIIRELESAYTQSQVDRLVDEFCSVAETLFQCIYNTFKRNCNSKVADMQIRVERLLTKPVMDELGCGKDTTPSARTEHTTKRNTARPRATPRTGNASRILPWIMSYLLLAVATAIHTRLG